MERSETTGAIWEGEIVEECRRFRGMVEGVVRDVANNNKLKLKKVCPEERIETMRKCPSILERVHQIIGELMEDVEGCKQTLKCDVTSRRLRQEANEFYRRRELASALRGFTLSLCFAPSDSIEMVLAYSNRSACFLEMNEPAKCLEDIESALAEAKKFSEVPKQFEVVRKKLLERKDRCEAKVCDTVGLIEKVETDAGTRRWECESYFQMKSPSNCIESAEDFVEIVFDPGRGRHVRVTKDVAPGTVIILEKPYSKILVNQVKWEIGFCHYCSRDISKSPCIPCTACAFAVYCNEECKRSHGPIHKYDCTLGPYLHRLDAKRLVLLSYRTVVNLGPNALRNQWKTYQSESKYKIDDKSILGFENGKYLSSSYHPIKCLIYHDESLTEEELSRYCIDSIVISELLYQTTEFFKSFPDDELMDLKNFAASLMLLHQMNFPCNAHSLNALKLSSPNPPAEEIQEATTTDFGAGAFALLSMINHSCDPNITRITLSNGVNAVVTIRRLQEDEEVLDNYGAHYALEDLPSRRKHLKTNYNFICDCIACTKSWPVLNVLQDQISKFICNACFKKPGFERLNLEKIVLQSNGQCKNCKSAYDLNSLDKELARNIEQFRYAFSLTLQNKPYKSIHTITESLAYFESQLLQPYIYTNFAQETLKQALNLLATYE